jgi:ABC-type polysaccharide/polyol phosphate transport system ATPase subunit
VVSIELDRVDVVFPVPSDKGVSLKELLTRRIWRRRRTRMQQVHALRDVSLSIGDGARIGVIGDNGAGKSTLLRTIAGVYPVERGRVEVHGRISSMFDITLGFERESTGWENIRFRSYLLGETPRRLEKKIREIGEFTELGGFLDVPLKCYSAGMVMRLAFAAATSCEPEILLIDEVFGTGDLSFRAKAKQRMEQLMESARIFVMVGHDLPSIASFCKTVVWMEHGRVRMVGPAETVLSAYEGQVAGCVKGGSASSPACTAA